MISACASWIFRKYFRSDIAPARQTWGCFLVRAHTQVTHTHQGSGHELDGCPYPASAARWCDELCCTNSGMSDCQNCSNFPRTKSQYHTFKVVFFPAWLHTSSFCCSASLDVFDKNFSSVPMPEHSCKSITDAMFWKGICWHNWVNAIVNHAYLLNCLECRDAE